MSSGEFSGVHPNIGAKNELDAVQIWSRNSLAGNSCRVAEIVDRIWEWHRAGLFAAPTVPLGETVSQTRCWGRLSMVASQGGALRTAVVSGQWLETAGGGGGTVG